jgi:nucleotide-binding universal stress UspA family protein
MHTIVVGYDGSEPAVRALERAAQLAHALRSRVIAVTVTEPIAAYGAAAAAPGYAAPVGPALEEVHEAQEARAERLLAEARTRLRGRGIEAQTVSALGAPAAAIVQEAEEHDADLIVVGTREPGFFERLYRGSVSQGVARKARCDVLVVHPEEPAGDRA